jgi:outer membrane protein assembly factor BamB
LIADRGNNRLLLVDGARRIVWRYPRAGQRPAFPFRYDDDSFFTDHFHAVITNQEDQQTVEVVGFPNGRVLWHYGHPDRPGSAPGYLNTPDDAYQLPDGLRTVADIRNCRVIWISPAHRIVRQIGIPGVCSHDPPHALGSPNGDTPLSGGGILVTEISGSWVDAISAAGKLLWSFQAPVAYPSDAQVLPSGRVLLADYSTPGQILILTRRGKVVWRYGPPSGPAALDHPSLALMLPGHLIAVNDDYRHRVVVISKVQHRIIWQYGHTDRAGTARGYLDVPDGIDYLPSSAVRGHPALVRLIRRASRRP